MKHAYDFRRTQLLVECFIHLFYLNRKVYHGGRLSKTHGTDPEEETLLQLQRAVQG